jgi:hypothetical protein
MKETKRALRRWKSKCKLEKRLKIWVKQGDYFKYPYNGDFNYCGWDSQIKIGGHHIEEVKNEVRAGKYWTFLKWTSTPCSCSMCSYPKYERTPKFKINKQIWDDIQDDLAS